MKTCTKCGEPKALDDFHRDRRKTDGRRSRCKACGNALQLDFQRKYRAETGQWYRYQYAYERTCEVCGTTWHATTRTARYCSTACTNKLARYESTCDGCGSTWLATQAKARWCSAPCLALWREKVERERRLVTWLPVLPGRPHGPAWIRLPDRHPARRRIPKARMFVQGNCIRCDTAFCVQATGAAFYCSTKCLRADGKAKRRALQRNAYVAHVYRARIFKRDNWTCQLCNTETDRDQVAPHPKAPVIDHIVPLAKGGTHEPANVQCAHFMCNSIKSDRTGAAQLMLIGQPHEETDIGEGTWRGALALFRTPTGR